MGKPGAYLQVGRCEHDVRPAVQAVRDFDDIVVDLPRDDQRDQASRCMHCGVAFCQTGMAFPGMRRSTGCPLNNLIPETNDLVYRGRWNDAAGRLSLTNPFPEFTGRVCPAPCEVACNLGLNDSPVTVHDNERAISDWLWETAGVAPLPHPEADAPIVSVVGSGPAGLAAAWEFARRGLRVRVYERDDRPGGLLMYGIPAMKLPKWVVERRVELMENSGIKFFCGVDAEQRAEELASQSAAVILAVGSRQVRRMDVPGVELGGVHYALDYLAEVTRALLDNREPSITAAGKDVVVIGGGDTGVDCIACALRQGAKSVCQVIRAQKPRETAGSSDLWPYPRHVDQLGYGQREACELSGRDPRLFCTDTVGFLGGNGEVSAVEIEDISYEGGRHVVADSRRDIKAQLVLVAKGFTGPESQVLDAFAPYGNVHLAGDARLGSTLVASAMADALEVARHVADLLLG